MFLYYYEIYPLQYHKFNRFTDLSYRKTQRVPHSKIPPKLLPDQPNYRPNNKNYVEYLDKLQKYKRRRGQKISQSLAIISYAKTSMDENQSPDKSRDQDAGSPDITHVKVLLIVTNMFRFQDTCKFHIRVKRKVMMRLILNKRMLMSKYIHQKFDPVFETEFAKAYFEGVENEPTIPGETITDLILRLGNYKGVIKQNVCNSFILLI